MAREIRNKNKRPTHFGLIVEANTSATGAGNGETIKTKYFGNSLYDCGGASRTGAILEAGTETGQKVTVVNVSDAAESVTFAAAGTSNVAGGTGVAVAQNEALGFIWDETTELWYPLVA